MSVLQFDKSSASMLSTPTGFAMPLVFFLSRKKELQSPNNDDRAPSDSGKENDYSYCKRQLSNSWGPRLFQNFLEYSGQIPIIPKPECFRDFEGKTLLNHHLG